MSDINDNWIRGLKYISIFIFFILTFVGVAIEAQHSAFLAKDFIENLIAEIAGISLGIFIAVTVIDKVKFLQWSEVRNYNYEGIACCLSDIISEMFVEHPLIFGFPNDLNDEPIAIIDFLMERLNDILKIIIKNETVPISSGEDLLIFTYEDISSNIVSKFVFRYYDKIKYNFAELKSILIPRVMQTSGDNVELIIALLKFESSLGRLQFEIDNYEETAEKNKDYESANYFLIRRLEELLKNSKALYQVLL